MKKLTYILLLGLVGLFINLSAQQSKCGQQIAEDPHWPSPSIEYIVGNMQHPEDEKNSLHFLQETYPNLFRDGSSLFLLSTTQSPFSIHYLYGQTYAGLPIDGNYLKINLTTDGRILHILNNTSSTASWDRAALLNQAFSTLPLADTLDYQSKDVIYLNDGEPNFGKLVSINTNDLLSTHKDYSIDYLVNANDVLYRHDLHSYFSEDTIATAYVFRPDPLTTAHKAYGGDYSDHNDSTNAALDNERKLVSITVLDSNDIFYLQNSFCVISDFAPPFKPVVSDSTPAFLYNRSDDAFEDVNAYYHILTMHRYINDSLGFSLVNYPIMVDAHGSGGADNSFFSYSTSPPSLQFGEGGVDDAEDADVLVHEYSHAISFSASPLTNNGRERRAIDEGFGDYLATSYSKSIDEFSVDSMFTWDGHNPFWPGRVANTILQYNAADSNGIYENGGIWCSALLEIEGKLGREKTNKLAIQAMYGEAANTKCPFAAQLLLQADTLLYGGVDYCKIVHSLILRNLLDNRYKQGCDFTDIHSDTQPLSTIQIMNEEGFANRNGSLSILNPDRLNCTINLVSIDGRLIRSMTTDAEKTAMASTDLPAGFYVIEVRAATLSMQKKLLIY